MSRLAINPAIPATHPATRSPDQVHPVRSIDGVPPTWLGRTATLDAGSSLCGSSCEGVGRGAGAVAWRSAFVKDEVAAIVLPAQGTGTESRTKSTP